MNKLDNFGTTIFTTMSALAAKHNAVNLAQGFPDFEPNPQIIEYCVQGMKLGFNQYAPMVGLLQLREAIAEKTFKSYNFQPNIDSEITVTSGATEAVFDTILSVVNQGDEVIVFEPAFDIYYPAIALCGGISRPLALSFPDFKIDFESLKNAINEKTKLIIINSPHNPTGSIIEKEELLKIAELIRDKEIYVLSDEVYEHIIFEGKKHCSVLEIEELRNKSFVISSLGKTFHLTGWRVGYVIAPLQLTKALRSVHQFNTFSANTPAQFAFATILQNSSEYESLPTFFQAKRDLFLELMKISSLKPITSYGTYFQLFYFEKYNEMSDIEYAKYITETIGVASIPVSVFYTKNTDYQLLRFCFAKKDETLHLAAEKLCKI